MKSLGKYRIILLLTFVQTTLGFYLPGVAPHDYKENEIVELKVNSLNPLMGPRNQLKSVISYDYYRPEFHFCQPSEGIISESESLGSILFGDRIFNSPFEVKMLQNKTCESLCQVDNIPAKDAQFINARIREHYAINWLIDGLPAARIKFDSESNEQFYSIGFELGSLRDPLDMTPSFNNHYDILIKYHTVDNVNYRVVGVHVWPKSRDYSLAEGLNCNIDEPLKLKELDDNPNVYFTYSVIWQPSDISWGTRWDNYLHVVDARIHWFNLINSLVIVLLLTGMVSMILLRTLRKDIIRYNQIEVQEDLQEDFGWKLVHADVFRHPPRSAFLAVLIGNGVQLLSMVIITLAFALLGFLSPSNRGSLITAMLTFYMLFGSLSGYYSAKFNQLFENNNFKKNIIISALFLPGIIFTMFILLNFFLIGVKSSSAVPAGTLFGLINLWFLVSAPLTFIGAYFASKTKKYSVPVRTNQIPRQIPDQVLYLKPIPSILMGGILPFGAIFIELFFIFNSIWFHKIYYVFGFLFLVFGIMIVTCSQVTILMAYFHLCAEDYRWWWRSFLTSGSASLYVLLYSLYYYSTRLEFTSLTSTILYFGWTLIICIIFFVLSGTIGFLASFLFIRKIYSVIKID